MASDKSIPSGFCHCGCGRPTGVFDRDRPNRGQAKGAHHKFVHGHNNRGDVSARFWARVDVRGAEQCWPWTGRTRNGYGAFDIGEETVIASRVAVELTRGPIPAGLLVCHRCDNPPCCNPDHLFVGSYSDNMADAIKKGRMGNASQPRKAACKHGHAFTPENTYIRMFGTRATRICRECKRLSVIASRAKRGISV